jgi:hypothetical protein
VDDLAQAEGRVVTGEMRADDARLAAHRRAADNYRSSMREEAVIRAEAAEARVAQLEGALREGGCQFYMDGEIGYCQKKGETNPCAACAALDAARPADTKEEA